MELYKEYEYEIGEIKKLQKELVKTSDSIQQYLQKQHENQMVKQELEFLNKEDNVYKLVGPVLIKEDLMEAKMNVDKRLDFIKKEIARFEKSYKDMETSIDNKKKKVTYIQERIMQLSKQLQEKNK